MNSQAALDTLELKTPPQALRGFMFSAGDVVYAALSLSLCYHSVKLHCKSDDIFQKAIFISSPYPEVLLLGCICASQTAFLPVLVSLASFFYAVLLIFACCTLFARAMSPSHTEKMQNIPKCAACF